MKASTTILQSTMVLNSSQDARPKASWRNGAIPHRDLSELGGGSTPPVDKIKNTPMVPNKPTTSSRQQQFKQERVRWPIP